MRNRLVLCAASYALPSAAPAAAPIAEVRDAHSGNSYERGRLAAGLRDAESRLKP
jgi:hypothetical protein